jgi:ribonuclease P protein subunit RPR2
VAKKYAKHKQLAGEIAGERVDILLAAAHKAAGEGGEGTEMAQRYVHVARKVTMRVRTPLDWQATRQVCKMCDSYMLAGTTARVRLQGKGKNAHVVVTCLHCGNEKRYHYHRARDPEILKPGSGGTGMAGPGSKKVKPGPAINTSKGTTGGSP